MNDPRDFKLDISSMPAADDSSSKSPSASRPYLMVHFKCCGVYQRIYRSNDGERYEGHCPKCAKPVRFKVAEGGTDARAFVVE